ncbi:MAG: phosphate regulon sensor histidine kinase PhoR [Gallionellaceae bacterium CG1_02_56_997]|nr:MAG: phosphate regulon sensor histidine kinase PhoR [Gallionellaceae bacterium CG1_02_56_997]PIV91026.1 MAG: PAS domain-containing sensor histidine kinase [Gallionellales bacterium CG17_big_fil_post_rev_8_21_14_2_50_54_146]HCJ52083.1 PAS domain-containing sensor histidine kinase [Gallionella sp.]
MQDFWFRVSFPVLLSAMFGLLLWGLFSPVVAVSLVLLVLVLVMLRHALQLFRLGEWLREPRIETIPEASGIWDEVFSLVYQMVKAQKQTKLELAAELKHIVQATTALPDGVAILNEANRIEWFNPLAEQHFGLNARQDVMQDITYLVRQPEFIEYLYDSNHDKPLVMRPARHDDRVLSIKLVPYGENKRLLISRDITQMERMETMRRDFVANVSHELRTPLTVVNGFVENLQDMPDLSPAKIRHALQLMAEQTRRMDSLVSDLLTLSSLENNQNPLRAEVVDMGVLLDEVCKDGQMLSAGRHVQYFAMSGPEKFLGNRDELRSAFGNLISNAVRYTPEGGTINISWELRNAQPVFSVQDSGIGIAAEHIPRLTERFYRVDRSRSRGTGGTGLGMAIVKHIALRHQAELKIESEEGVGSTFSMVFPARRIAA